MKRLSLSFCSITCLLVLVLAGAYAFQSVNSGAPQSASAQGETVVKVSVNEVILDVVVTDKKGNQIKGLRPADFEIREDGVPQKIGSIHEVTTLINSIGDAQKVESVPKEAPLPESAPRRTAVSQLNLINLVFDRISIAGRLLARDAALQYIKALGPNDYVSVMAIDRVLRVLVPYSQDATRLKEAILMAAGGTSQQFAEVSGAIRDAANQADTLTAEAEDAAAAVGQGGGLSPEAGAKFANAAFSRAMIAMLQQGSIADETIQGRSTVEALISLIRGARTFPGRKAVVFFGERIALPTQVIERFRDLISAANRANVSFYCIDTTGLESKTQLGQMSGELSRIAAVSKRQMTRRAGAVQQDEVMLAEDTNNVIRDSTQNNLVDLAESTGGVMIANTNDLSPGLRRVSEDLRSHYELTYIPTNMVYDGSFRKVEVKVKRSGLVARSREGYYAFRSNDVAESPFELPLLATLNSEKPPHDLTILNSSMIFPTSGAKSEALFYSEIPLSDFDFPIDTKKKEYKAKVQVLVAVKNTGGRIIEKFSQEFPLQGPAAKAAETRDRNFLFYRTAMLYPGRYSVETVVHDPLGGKSSIKRAVLVVPSRPAQSLAMSSIVLVKRLDGSRSDANLIENPLVLGNQMVVPYLESVISLKDALQLAFYIVATAPGGSDIKMDTVLSKDGKPMGHTGEQPLPAPDSHGIIRCITTLPIAELTEGNYDVQVVIRQGGAIINGRAAFSIQ